KLSILLKNRETGGKRDATKALKADLRKLAKGGDWEKYQKATKLAALLDAVRKCPTLEGSDEPLASDLNQILEKHHEAVVALCPETDNDDILSGAFENAHRLTLANKGDFADFIGTELTTLLHPEKVARFKASEVAPAVVGKLIEDGLLDRLKKMGVEPNSQDAYV